jgi:hypothetical protein
MKVREDSFEPYMLTTVRSDLFADKTTASEGNTEIRGTKYYQRVFTDGCVELVRYCGKTKMWAILCFPSEDKAS